MQELYYGIVPLAFRGAETNADKPNPLNTFHFAI